MNIEKNLTPESPMSKIEIDIWSDIVCPFCYIGKRHLEQALDQAGLTDSVNVVWHSFELNPGAETNPDASIYDVLATRKGWTPEQSKQIHRQVEERAGASGLLYDFDKTIPANSRNAHRLLHLAKKHGVQNQVKELLLSGYFTDGKNIDQFDFLAQTARSAGIPEDEVRDCLNSDAFDGEIAEDIKRAREMGVQGVPFFVFNRKYAISGAQPVEVFVQALETVADEMELSKQPDEGAMACGPDQTC